MATTLSSTEVDQARQHELFKHRFWGRFVTEVIRAAESSATDEYERESNIRRGLDILETTVSAVSPDWWGRDDEQAALPWHHLSKPLFANKKHGDPYIMVLVVEEAAADYLILPYRVNLFDRLLTDMLMAAEILAFADEAQPQLKQKLPIIPSWLWRNLKSLVVGLAIAGALMLAAPNIVVVQWIAGIIAGFTVLGVTFSLLAFPFFYPRFRAQRQKFDATVRGMVDAYTALGGSPASVAHVRRLVDRASDAGVVWPSPLMALLDDIADRRKAI